MHSIFLQNIVLLIFINILVKPLWIFGVDRNVQNILGAATYGEYFMLFNISVLFTIVMDMGIQTYIATSFSKDHGLYYKKLFTLAVIKLVWAVLFFIITFGFALFVYKQSINYTLLTLLCINQIFASFIMFIRSVISAHRYYRIDNLLSACDKFIMLLLGAYFVYIVQNITIPLYVIIQTIAYGVTLIISFIILWYKNGSFVFRFDSSNVKSIFLQVLPFAGIVFIMSFYSRLDTVYIYRLVHHADHEIGIYASAYRLYDSASMIGVMFASLLLPMFSSIVKNQIETSKLITMGLKILFLITVGLFAFSIASLDSLYLLLFDNFPNEQRFIIPILCAALICLGFMQVLGSLLTAHGHTWSLLRFMLSGLVVNFVLNICLTSKMGIMGTSICVLLTQSYIALGMYIITYQKMRYVINKLLLVRSSIYLFVMISASYLFMLVGLPWIICLALLMMLAISSSIWLNIIGWKELQLMRPQ